MKGVIHAGCPGVDCVDLTHEVRPHDVRGGAWALYASHRWFPRGTVFLCVVDPGVGGERQAVAVQTAGYRFVGPDNGLLYPAVAASSPGAGEADAGAGDYRAVALPVPRGASRTFHGRDVFAPAAARLARGDALTDLGPPTTLRRRLEFNLQGREGEVVTVDRFGNIVTNLPPAGCRHYRLRGGGLDMTLPLCESYEEGRSVSGAFVIVGSAGTLELSAFCRPADGTLKLARGDRLALEPVDSDRGAG